MVRGNQFIGVNLNLRRAVNLLVLTRQLTPEASQKGEYILKHLPRLMMLVGLLLGLFGTTVYAAFGESVLKLGMNGEDVTVLQTKLKALGYDIDNIDGDFGNVTLRAVLAFQTDNGMDADGIVGDETFRRLAVTKPVPAKYTVQQGDTLYGVAQRHNISVGDLSRANNIDDRTVLRIGQELILPGGKSVSRGSVYSARSKGMQIVDMAQKFINVPYTWGGSSPGGFDCSGFTYYIFAKHGLALPRMADGQFEVGKRVAKSDLLPGDLVFFETYETGPSHVGIYMGNGQFIHASSGAGRVTVTSMSKPYYVERYLGARRLI